jgi:hypothetical protein
MSLVKELWVLFPEVASISWNSIPTETTPLLPRHTSRQRWFQQSEKCKSGSRYAPSTRIIPVLWPLIPAKDLVLDENIWLCPSLLFFPSLFREFSYWPCTKFFELWCSCIFKPFSSLSYYVYLFSAFITCFIFPWTSLTLSMFLWCCNPLLSAARHAFTPWGPPQASTLLGGPLEDLRLGWSSWRPETWVVLLRPKTWVAMFLHL